MSDVPSTADWMSAWANIGAALGTVGALWVGTVTLRRQVKDQHRAQASAIAIRVVALGFLGMDGKLDRSGADIFNASPLPIFNVTMECFDRAGLRLSIERHDVVPSGQTMGTHRFGPEHDLGAATVEFSDSAQNRWRRHSNGSLTEIRPRRWPWHLRNRSDVQQAS